MTTRIYADGQAYGRGKVASMSQYPDHGCREATQYLGKPSECLECPFEECKDDSNKTYIERQRLRLLMPRVPSATQSKKVRNNRIYKASDGGMCMMDIAAIFNLNYHTVYGILQSRRNAHG